MEITGITNIGKIRQTNEDSFLVSCDCEPYYAMVADGMGGHAAGEIASGLAVVSIEKYFKSLNKKILVKEDIEKAVHNANNSIIKKVEESPDLKGMGTTLTLAFVTIDKFIIAQVGDSSAYLINKNAIRKITKDHTYVQHLIDCGVIKSGSAEDYPFKNIITRALGMQNLKVDLYEECWNKNDVLLLCSDGLSGYTTLEQIKNEINNSTNLKTAANNLVNYALNAGGRDNITAVLIKNSGSKEN